jgi:ectoine hydroxylase-related dioxygenase (phytanoyl-CoA dioxygenase family)
MKEMYNDYSRAKFSDSSLESEMCENGFVYIPSYISQTDLSSLLDLYHTFHTSVNAEKGMWNSLYDVGPENATLISDKILSILMPYLAETFKGFKAPVASFMSKNPGDKGICEFHRDFSILDETQVEYRNIWIPLIDINRGNGALYALRKSHRVFNYPLPMFEKWNYVHLQDKLFSKASVFEVNAGDLVVYADRTLHGSFLNLSQHTRPVVHLGVLPQNYQLAYYHLDNKRVKVHAVSESYYFSNEFVKNKDYFPVIHEFEYVPPIIDEEKLNELG